jgi:hypothetical protein
MSIIQYIHSKIVKPSPSRIFKCKEKFKEKIDDNKKGQTYTIDNSDQNDKDLLRECD